MVKHLPAMQETRVQSLGQEDPVEKGVATHSSILAWRIPQTVEPGGLQSIGSQRVGHELATNTHGHQYKRVATYNTCSSSCSYHVLIFKGLEKRTFNARYLKKRS